jgi:hypothetical protein
MNGSAAESCMHLNSGSFKNGQTNARSIARGTQNRYTSPGLATQRRSHAARWVRDPMRSNVACR